MKKMKKMKEEILMNIQRLINNLKEVIGKCPI